MATESKPGPGEDEAAGLAAELSEYFDATGNHVEAILPILARFLRVHDSGDQWLNALDRAEKAEAALAQSQRRAQEAEADAKADAEVVEDHVAFLQASWLKAEAERDAARAEVERLRAALRNMLDLALKLGYEFHCDVDGDPEVFAARAFLARPKQEPLHQSDCPHADPQAPCICPEQEPEPPREVVDLLVVAWGIIANVGGGDWTSQTPGWQAAVATWRDRWLQKLAPAVHPEAPRPPQPHVHVYGQVCPACADLLATPPPLPGAPEEKK